MGGNCPGWFLTTDVEHPGAGLYVHRIHDLGDHVRCPEYRRTSGTVRVDNLGESLDEKRVHPPQPVQISSGT